MRHQHRFVHTVSHPISKDNGDSWEVKWEIKTTEKAAPIPLHAAA
jgi:hypothetical protein